VNKQAPTLGRLLAMVVFALSCFGLLLFLWASFGGSIPLKPKGYRFQVAFDEATQLADSADVRISGVPVGRVRRLDRRTDRTIATIELESRYAPLPSDARATLRLKTLLGETFVELSPGTPGAPKIPEGGMLAASRVRPTVELDEVLRVFDERTRRDFRRFFEGLEGVAAGRGQDVNDALGALSPALQDGTSLLRILDAQERAVSQGTRDTGRVFAALGRGDGALRSLVTAGERVLDTTATRQEQLREVLRILPTFQDELRPTLRAVDGLVTDAAPVVRALRPVAPQVRPLLDDTAALAPDLDRLFRDVDPVVARARTGLPALTRTLDAARPLVGRLDPLARDLGPIARFVQAYRLELMQSFMNVAAATNAKAKSPGADRALPYLRVLPPVWGENLVQAQGRRQPSNRSNPYPEPGAQRKLEQGGLEAYSCAHTKNPQTTPLLGSAPGCVEQGPWEFDGRSAAFPRLERDPQDR
jgi:virulence factor Mce-like protein